MGEYRVPHRDIRFVLNELLNVEQHYQELNCEEATPDMIDAILDEAGKFSERVIAPLNQVGDKQGCSF